MEIYETVKSIGSGSFGQVYLSRNKREDKLYVIKRIKTRDISDKDREAIENEVIPKFRFKSSKISHLTNSGARAAETSPRQYRGLQRQLPGSRAHPQYRDALLRGRRHVQQNQGPARQADERAPNHGLFRTDLPLHFLSSRQEDSPPRPEDPKHFPEGRAGAYRGLRHRQSAGLHARPRQHVHRHPLLHVPGAVQVQALLLQERYLGSGVHFVRNVLAQARLRCPESQRPGGQNHEGQLPAGAQQLQQALKRPDR